MATFDRQHFFEQCILTEEYENYPLDKVYLHGVFYIYSSPTIQAVWEEWSGQEPRKIKGEY